MTTQCDTLTDNSNANRHDCFESFVLRFGFGIVLSGLEIESNRIDRLWRRCIHILMRILPVCRRMAMLLRFFECKSIRSGTQVETQIHRFCTHLLCDDFSHIACQLINGENKINTNSISANWKLCLAQVNVYQTEINSMKKRLASNTLNT